MRCSEGAASRGRPFRCAVVASLVMATLASASAQAHVAPPPSEVPMATLASAVAACLNPVTCVPPFDNLGIPSVPPPAAPPGGATTPDHHPPSLTCDRRDYVTNMRSTYLATDEIPAIVDATPAEAVARYVLRPSLPPGLDAADWALHQSTARPTQAYLVTRAPSDAARILGVIGLERVNTSWRAYFLSACGEYLYPGSLTARES